MPHTNRKAHGALAKIDISNNKLCAAGGKALAEALSGNEVMTELNIASNHLGSKKAYGDADMSGVSAISDAIPTMGALVKLTMGANHIRGAEAGKALGAAIAANTVLKELDLSKQGQYFDNNDRLDAPFAKEFAIGLSTNGALASLDLSQNSISESESSRIKAVCEVKSISLKV